MKIRLTEAAFLNGRRYDRDEIVEIPDGTKGPHRAVSRAQDRIDYSLDPPIDANRQLGEIEDVPLYEVVKEKKKTSDG